MFKRILYIFFSASWFVFTFLLVFLALATVRRELLADTVPLASQEQTSNYQASSEQSQNKPNQYIQNQYKQSQNESQSSQTSGHDNGSWRDYWDLALAVGYGQRSRPLIGQENRDIYLSVDIAFYRGRFFFDSGDVGYNIANGELFKAGPNTSYSVNLIARWNNERELWGSLNKIGVQINDPDFSSGSDNPQPDVTPDPSNPNPNSGDFENSDDDPGVNPTPAPTPAASQNSFEIASRDTSLLAGLEYITESSLGVISATAMTDTLGKHHGNLLNVSYRYPFIWQRWFLQPELHATWKSAALNNYYFGITTTEANTTESNTAFDAYEADGDIDVGAGLLVNYALAKNWFWGLSLRYTKLGGEVVDSPLIEDDAVRIFFTGLKYQF